jgi:site-specific DNA-cytosine methylase
MKKILFIDLFSGGGGASCGIESVKINGENVAKVIAAVDMDGVVMDVYKKNHPEDVLCLVQDVRDVRMDILSSHLRDMKEKYSSDFTGIWASPPCTEFSMAKNTEKNSEVIDLPNSVYRYAVALHPDFIVFENVVQMRKWEGFEEFIWKYEGLGYRCEMKIMSADDYGCFINKKRLYTVFYKTADRRFVFPEPEAGLKKRSAAEIIDFSLPMKSIFGREKKLKVKTYDLINRSVIRLNMPYDTDYALYQYRNTLNCRAIDKPLYVVTVRNYPYLCRVFTSNGISIPVTGLESDEEKRLRNTMRERSITGIAIRGLTVPEMAKASSLPENYIFGASKFKAVDLKILGNLVLPPMSRLIVQEIVKWLT